MKEKTQVQPITQVNVLNYEVETFTMPVSTYLGFKNMPKTSDAPTILNIKNVPSELALLLEKRIVEAMTSQVGYNQLLHFLNTPSV